MKKTLTTITLLLLTACNLPNTQTYSNDQFSITYPDSYSIEISPDEPLVTTIKRENGRLEIFDINDFGTERLHGFSSSGLEEYEAELVPKEKLTKENYEIWLFYSADDIQTKEELQNIAESLVLQ